MKSYSISRLIAIPAALVIQLLLYSTNAQANRFSGLLTRSIRASDHKTVLLHSGVNLRVKSGKKYSPSFGRSELQTTSTRPLSSFRGNSLIVPPYINLSHSHEKRIKPNSGRMDDSVESKKFGTTSNVERYDQSNPEATRKFIEARDFLIRHRTDYETAYRDFEWPRFDGSESFNWALDVFDPLALGNETIALKVVGKTLEGAWTVEEVSYDTMARRTSHLAKYFQKLGMKKGDRILIYLPNSVPLFETLLASIKLGLEIIPASNLAKIADLEDRIGRGDAKFLVTDQAGSTKIDQCLITHPLTKILTGPSVPGWISYEAGYEESEIFKPDSPTKPNDLQFLYFTSGTTAKSKMARHTHQSYAIGNLSTLYGIGIQEGDIHQSIGETGWAKHAWSNFFAPWSVGATSVVHNYSRFDPVESLKVISDHHVSTLCAPPTFWRKAVAAGLGERPAGLKEIVSAGEALEPEVIQTVYRQWGLTIRPLYGQTETTAQVGISPGQPTAIGAMGKSLPGFRHALLDEDHHPILNIEFLGKNTQDEDVYRDRQLAVEMDLDPVGVLDGYENNPEANEKSFTNGFFHTGDRVYRKKDGLFYFAGRDDDMFKVSGHRVGGFELESILKQTSNAILESAVIGVPEEFKGSEPKAFILLKPGIAKSAETAREVFSAANAGLASYRMIRRVEFVDKLPKTITGKIQRTVLRTTDSQKSVQRKEFEYLSADFE